MKKLIIDKSSICSAYIHLEDENYGATVIHNDKEYHIPDIDTCMERFEKSIDEVLDTTGIRFSDVISVNDPGGRPKCRTKILSIYKQKTRDEPPERTTLRNKFYKKVDRWLLSKGALVATPECNPSVEADDLINEFSKRLEQSIIWTRDKDLLACPGDVLYVGSKEKEYNPTDKFPVENKYIHVYRTIVENDKSDNVGSCKNFGPVKWEKMLQLAGTEGYPKKSDDIIDILEELFRSAVPKSEAAIRTDIEFNKTAKKEKQRIICKYKKNKDLDQIESSIKDFPPFRYIVDQIEDLYDSYRVLSFFPVPLWKIKWEVGMPSDSSTLVTQKNFQKVLKEIPNQNFNHSVIDFETDVDPKSRVWSKRSGIKVDVIESKICGMGLRINRNNYYFSVDHKDTDNISLDQLKLVLDLLKGKPVYAHNSTGFENVIMYQQYKEFLPDMYDTLTMGHYVDENDYTNLKHLSEKYLGYVQKTYKETLDGKSGMRELTATEVFNYGIDDVITCDVLHNLFATKMELEGTLKVFEEVEINAGYFTSLCFIHGIDFDEKRYNALKKKNDQDIKKTWLRLSRLLIQKGWPGGIQREITHLNMGTFNKIYKAQYGTTLTGITSVRAAIRFLEGSELAEIAKARDFKKLNKYYSKYWKAEAEFNVRSSVQMKKLLYETLGLMKRIHNPLTKKMKEKKEKELKIKAKEAGISVEDFIQKKGIKINKGTPATNDAAIQNAIAFDANKETINLLQTLLNYKGYLTKESLFLEKYPKFVHWKTGKFHAQLQQSFTTTRRYTCSKPNFQQLPKFKGKEFRNMLRSRKGYSFVALDFSGQELRLAAWDSQDQNFLDCYREENKTDVHSKTGLGIAQSQGIIKYEEKDDKEGTAYDEFISLVRLGNQQAKDCRTIGKKINFTCQYGAGPDKVAQTLCISKLDAIQYINSRAEAFPELIARVEEWHKICEERKYATTFLGGRRHLHDGRLYSSSDKGRIGAANRLAYSMRIQGSAAEMTKLVCGKMYEEGIFDNGDVRCSTTIHDEIVLQVKDEVLNETIPILVRIMCQPYADMKIDLETEPEVGKHLGELKPWSRE